MPRKEKKPPPDRPKYEAPKLLELGALARGAGAANCQQGTSPGALPCLPGFSPQGACVAGAGIT